MSHKNEDVRCVTHHLACECREAEFARVQERLRQYIAYGPRLSGATNEHHLQKRIDELEEEIKVWKNKALGNE